MAYVESQQMRNWVLKLLQNYTTTDEGGGTEGTVTSVVAGDGMDFTTITDAGSIVLGTPSSLDGNSINAATATSHTHAISLTKADIGLSNVPNTDIAYSSLIPADDFTQSEVDNLKDAKLNDGTTPWIDSYLPLSGGILTLGEGLEFIEDYSINSLAGHTPNDSRIINLYDNSPPTDGALLITYDTTTSGDYAGEILYIDKDNFEWFGETVATQNWVENNSTLYTHPNHTGQVTSIGDGATILTVSAISNQSNLPTSLVDTDEFIINSGGVLYKTNMAVLSNYVAVETVSFGTEGQIPYMNSINDDFDYSPNLVFDETDLTVSGGIKLLTGATVDTIETTLTDDDTHLPTSGAVKDAVIYTNATPMPEEVGGLEVGSTFDEETIEEMFTSLLYPYQYPSFSAFAISGQTTPLEVGDSILANRTFTWTTVNSSNVETDSLVIRDVTGSTDIETSVTDDGSEATVYGEIQKTTATTNTFKLTGTNSKSESFYRNYIVYWRWKLYYGEDTNTPLNEAAIESLRVGVLSSGFAGTYSFNALTDGYKYICYPEVLGTATSFKDTATQLPVPFETVYTVSVTNTYGVTTDYNVHRSTNILNGTINIIIA